MEKQEGSLQAVEHHPWSALLVFDVYHLSLVTLLFLSHILAPQNLDIGVSYPKAFYLVAMGYLAFNLVGILFGFRRWPSFQKQAALKALVAIIVLTLLLHTNGGGFSDLLILINVTIAGGSLLTEGRISLALAAAATFAVFLEQITMTLFDGRALTNYLQIGVLGLTFFATAIVGYVLARRLQSSEIIAQQRAQALAKLQQLNAHVIQRLQVAIIVVDGNDCLQLLNRAGETLLGVSEFKIGKPLAEIALPLAEQLSRWRVDCHWQAQPFSLSAEQLQYGAQFTRLDDDAVLIFVEDLARTAQQAQEMKLASLGRLSASIAHELRNPLSAIGHAAQLLQESQAIESSDRRLVEIVNDNVLRTDSIIANVLQLSRRRLPVTEILNLKHWLKECVPRCLPDTLMVNYQCLCDEVEVMVDPNQLEQVVVNLCENGARYSEKTTGLPSIDLVLGRDPESGWSYLEVIDVGPGLNAEAEEHLFEPFFTTEMNGTGLGLFIARELCAANNAQLNYFNPSHGGAGFRVTFFG